MTNYDIDHDGTIEKEDIELLKEIRALESSRRKEITQRRILWGVFAIILITIGGSGYMAWVGLNLEYLTWIVPVIIALITAAITPTMGFNPMSFFRNQRNHQNDEFSGDSDEDLDKYYK